MKNIDQASTIPSAPVPTNTQSATAASGPNTARVVQHANEAFVQVERHEQKPVEGVLIIDLTASRSATRDAFVADFTQASEQFEELVKRVSSIGNVALTLIVHNGSGVRKIGRYESPKELGEALRKIDCVNSLTRIAEAFGQIPPNAHFVIVNGDTTDGDTLESLVEKAKAAGIPIIPLLEKTEGSDGTNDAHIEALRQMGEASGVKGGPFSFKTRMSLLDFVAVSAAAVRGPAAVEELKATGTIDQEVWEALPPQTVKSISASAMPSTALEIIPRRISKEQTPPANNVTNRNGVQILGGIGDGTTVTIHFNTEHGQPPAVTPSTPSQSGNQNRSRWGRIAAITAGVGIVGAALGYSLGKDSAVQPVTADPLKDLRQSAGTNILFDTGSARLSQSAIIHLDDIAKQMRGVAGPVCVVVTGHSSVTGPDAINRSLSEERANAVADHLIHGANVDPKLIKIESQGTSMPHDGSVTFSQRVETSVAPGPC